MTATFPELRIVGTISASYLGETKTTSFSAAYPASESGSLAHALVRPTSVAAGSFVIGYTPTVALTPSGHLFDEVIGGQRVTADLQQLRINYFFDYKVPEPSAYVLLALGIAAAARRTMWAM